MSRPTMSIASTSLPALILSSTRAGVEGTDLVGVRDQALLENALGGGLEGFVGFGGGGGDESGLAETAKAERGSGSGGGGEGLNKETIRE